MTTEQTIAARRARLKSTTDEAQDSLDVGRGYSRFVKLLRIILPLIALGIIMIMIFTGGRNSPVLPVDDIPVPTVVADGKTPSIEKIEKNELIAPHFESQTKDGKAYSITATEAVQELRQPDLVLLTKPRGEIETAKSPLIIAAENGTYNQKTQFITLSEAITISQDGTGTLHLKTLEADLKDGIMTSPLPLHAEGTYGKLNATALDIKNDGMTLIFHGPVTVTLTEGFETWLD